MKKILVILFSLISFIASAQTFNPTTGTVSNKPYSPAQSVPTDARSQFFDGVNFLWRPYQNTTEVLTYLNLPKYRGGNYIIVVDSGGTLNGNGTYTSGTNTFYMFKDGVADLNLVKLNLFGGGGACVGCLLATNNLSDVANAATSRTNLGLGTMATQNVAASGDLSGNWPNITVAKFNGQLPSFYLNYLNLFNTPTIPAQLNPACIGCTITGSYPNLTWTVTGAGFNTAGVDLKAISSSTVGIDTQNYRKMDTLISVNDSTLNFTINGSPYSITVKGGNKGGGGGTGTVTTVSVVTANGVSGSVANPSSTPAITLTLANITPTTVNGLTLAALSTGFTVSGGTTSKTLTVPLNATVSGTNTGDVTLTGENYLSLTGQVINANPVNVSGTNITGVLKAASFPAQTGDVTNSAGSLTTTISNNAVTNAKLAQAPTLTIKGNNTGGTANEADLTVAQVNAILPVFTTTLNGLVPDPGSVTGNVLSDAGTWISLSTSINLTQNHIPYGNAINKFYNSTRLVYDSTSSVSAVTTLFPLTIVADANSPVNNVGLTFDYTNDNGNYITALGGGNNSQSITTGALRIVSIGTDANRNLSNGVDDISLGSGAGQGTGHGKNDIYIGSFSGLPLTGSPPDLSRIIAIGAYAGPFSSAASGAVNDIMIGDTVQTDSTNVAIFGRKDQRIVLGNGGGNTAAMNALHNGIVGAIFFNTDSTLTGSGYCVWQGAKWINLGAASSGGGGSITGAGNLVPIFTSSVVGSTINFTLTNASANTALGNFTGSSAAPSYGKVPLAAMATQAPNTLVVNATGSTASPTAVPLGYGLIFQSGALALDSAHLKDTIYAANGLQVLGTHMDSIGLGGRLFQNTIVSGANAFAMTYDSFPVAIGRGFRVNFGSDAGWDLFTRDSATGFWTRIPKGTPGQALTMLSSGGIGWGTGGGGSGITVQRVTSGTSGTVTGSNYFYLIDPTSTIASYAATMPASPADGQTVIFAFGGTLTSGTIVTALSILPNTSQAIIDNTPPTSATADNEFEYRWVAANSKWYRFKP